MPLNAPQRAFILANREEVSRALTDPLPQSGDFLPFYAHPANRSEVVAVLSSADEPVPVDPLAQNAMHVQSFADAHRPADALGGAAAADGLTVLPSGVREHLRDETGATTYLKLGR